jgi:hypothetical protein
MKTKKSNAVVVRESQPLTSSQVLAGLNAIRGVMKECMVEKQDYGTVPGCGPKPGLFQPGAQKLSMMFQLNPEVREEIITDYPGFNRGYRLTVRVTNGMKFADGVGECSTLESKYRYRQAEKVCPSCGKTAIIKGKEEYGGGWVCFVKKGGCGEKWSDGTEQANAFEAMASRVENENPPDCWNTVRKMAFKRAFVHAIINATNTSELWSQDLEDLAANGMAPQPDTGAFEGAKPQKSSPKETKTPPKSSEIEMGASSEDMELVDFTVEDKQSKNGKAYTVWTAKFKTDSGADFTAGTIKSNVGEALGTLKGNVCSMTYKPGKYAGTYELLAIEPAENDLPM